MSTTTVEVGVIPRELASHWRQVFDEAGLGAGFEGTGDELRVLVAPKDEAAARALFEPPEELTGDEPAEEPVEAPTLGPNDRTETLVMTQHALIADRLCRELHKQGLFASVLSGLSASVFGTEGAQQFTVVVAEGQRDAASEVLAGWAATHANDFATEASLSREELFEVLRHFVRAGPGR